jgi:hypothetical protein
MEAAIRANHQYGKSRRSIFIFQPGRQVCSDWSHSVHCMRGTLSCGLLNQSAVPAVIYVST